MSRTALTLSLLLTVAFSLSAQSLLDELNNEIKLQPDTVYAQASFKAPRLVNGQTFETTGKGGLNFIISHRFGNLNEGIDNFYGLDESHIRLGLEYGLFDRIDIGVGRSREQKLVDGYTKIKLLRQSSGALNIPVSISLYTSTAIRTDKGTVPGRKYTLSNRLNFVYELLIARKFSERLSMQIMPGIVHRNLTINKQTPNIVVFTGVGGRFKISSRISLNTEYYYSLNSYNSKNFVNPLSIGFDIETGGHIFQLHFSNARAMHEKIMIAENTNDWMHSDVGFGFNIIRHFNLRRK